MKTKVLIDNKTIEARVKELGETISAQYTDGKPILCVCVLRGAFMFFSELVRHIKGDVTVDFITVSSYAATKTTGKVTLVSELREKVEGKHILIIEDIVDSGYTIDFLRKYFRDKNALSVKVACLIDKPMSRIISVKADYIAFTLDKNVFIVGYGLDYEQKFRNLDNISEVEFE